LEAKPEPGGMLRYGIPAYRLPKSVVDWEIEGLLALGVAVRTGVKLGRDFTLTQLQRQGYEAVFVGIGAWSTPHLCVPGEYATGVLGSLDFLSQIGTVYASLTGRDVCVIGESNTAMDCARSSIRLGARTVTVICPCKREEMSARKRDVDRAVEEGVAIHFMTQPVRVDHDAIGCAIHLVFRRLRTDSDGSRKNAPRCVPVDGSEQRTAVDLVITAYERKPDLTCLLDGEDKQIAFKITPNATLSADGETQLAAPPNIFAAGDLHTGRATVIGAISGGRLAAHSIHHLLTTGKVLVPPNRLKRINPRSILKDIRVIDTPARAKVSELPVALRKTALDREVVPTIGTAQAFTEARRCLQCGTYCYDR
jgi:formate dehydrogenase beta subunit